MASINENRPPVLVNAIKNKVMKKSKKWKIGASTMVNSLLINDAFTSPPGVTGSISAAIAGYTRRKDSVPKIPNSSVIQ